MSIEKLYNCAPSFIQTLMINAYACKIGKIRFGKMFEKLMLWLEETEKWSIDELKSYQNEQLVKIIQNAYDNVEYYNKLMNDNKITTEDIRCIEDLHKLPITTKNDIRKNIKSFISAKYKQHKLYHGHTSGTTGSPLDLYWDVGMVVMNNAMDWRQKRWAGLCPGDRRAVILGRVIVPVERKSKPFWRMNYIHGELWMSAFHMSKDNLSHYISKLNNFEPKYIEGYPSTIYILARAMLEDNVTIKMNAVITSSETLFSYQREVIEKAFLCRVFDFYCMAERVVFASECQSHSGRHLNLEYGITEVVDEYNNILESGTGRLVGTSLHNYGMPLIRYQTNDMSNIRKGECGCGLCMPIIDQITTKYEDIILNQKGMWISPSVLTHPFKSQKNLIESQIIQKSINKVLVKIVVNKMFNSRQAAQLVDDLQQRLGEGVEIDLCIVKEIPRESSGKYRWVISELRQPHG